MHFLCNIYILSFSCCTVNWLRFFSKCTGENWQDNLSLRSSLFQKHVAQQPALQTSFERGKKKKKKILSLWQTVNVRFCWGCFVTILILSGRSGRVCFLWALYDGRCGMKLAHTDQWAQIRMEGRKKKGHKGRWKKRKNKYKKSGDKVSSAF